MEEKGMKAADFLAISDKLKKTNEDDTPFAIVKDQEVSVIGDANKTEIKQANYSVRFRVPKTFFEEAPEGAKEVGSFYVFNVDFEGVTITPRSDLKIVDAIMKIIPFFNKLRENGEVEAFDKEELLSIFVNAGDDVHLAIYNLVATFLGIDDQLGEYMLPFSVIENLNKIMDSHPEVFNEADVFFG
ncbi:hypothetical protein IW492_01945 [Enterococcus sp. BWB1-3]|uniref:hypothetical protein n=1 Tax=unclassified Enterococcus TaxID=2608891 RepID=UPI0019246410|nr:MULTISPECIES: hypothetical protein [unclassified Enterococcus]MBL1227991.1 hypothetical protein [Enterococcus sp. BWB1-3]MCB5951831.1 hypothetical protein [Enterococcus sp. BWT-B8]MCB5954028.1 hypothetical protein [Enterococcus sp. CWB-B31]